MKTTSTLHLSIRGPAEAAGIANGKQLAEATGLSLNTSYELWKEHTTRVDLSTLATLCRVFSCDLADILLWSSAKKETAIAKRSSTAKAR